MRMSQGVEWASHACCLLAPLPPGTGLPLAALGEYIGVPAPYMAKQMQRLSAAGIVRASRGKTGGYALARPANEITLWQVTRAIDGPAPLFRCSEVRQRGPCASPRENCRKPCGIAAAFATAETAWRLSLEAVTIANLTAQAAESYGAAQIERAGHWLRENLTVLPTAARD